MPFLPLMYSPARFMHPALSIVLLLASASPACAAGDAARGQTLYQSRCTACHSLDYNGVGPAHRGLWGRKAGSAPGFAYSAALKASNIVWREGTLQQWLADPEKFVPGQKMGVSVIDAVDRADLVAYLAGATVSAKSNP